MVSAEEQKRYINQQAENNNVKSLSKQHYHFVWESICEAQKLISCDLQITATVLIDLRESRTTGLTCSRCIGYQYLCRCQELLQVDLWDKDLSRFFLGKTKLWTICLSPYFFQTPTPKSRVGSESYIDQQIWESVEGRLNICVLFFFFWHLLKK